MRKITYFPIGNCFYFPFFICDWPEQHSDLSPDPYPMTLTSVVRLDRGNRILWSQHKRFTASKFHRLQGRLLNYHWRVDSPRLCILSPCRVCKSCWAAFTYESSVSLQGWVASEWMAFWDFIRLGFVFHMVMGHWHKPWKLSNQTCHRAFEGSIGGILPPQSTH